MKGSVSLILSPRAAQRVANGYPWVFRSDVINAKDLGEFPAGVAAQFIEQNGTRAGIGYAHPSAQLMGRVLSTDAVEINAEFFERAFTDALKWREQCFNKPYYRLVHSDSDNLSGLIIDRFNDTLVVQVNTAGMEGLQDLWIPALKKVVQPKNIILKNDSTGRSLEGLSESVDVIMGKIPAQGLIELIENDTKFYADVLKGQKTGWFYDQRPHRAWVAALAKNKTLIDVFCHTGGFGITAARHGAKHVTFVDTSAAAIALTKQNAVLNNITGAEFIEGKAFDVLEKLDGKTFDVVCVDPPAFVKTKKDMESGLKGYEKLARLAAPLVAQGGVLFYASCSSHPTEQDILDAVIAGASKVKRSASLIYMGTAGMDHPMHSQLPETRYLKALGFRIT